MHWEGNIKHQAWHDKVILLKATTPLTTREISRVLHKSEGRIYHVLRVPAIRDKINEIIAKNSTDFENRRKAIIPLLYKHIEDVMRCEDPKDPIYRDKTKVALDGLKGFGEFAEKHELTGADGGAVRIEVEIIEY